MVLLPLPIPLFPLPLPIPHFLFPSPLFPLTSPNSPLPIPLFPVHCRSTAYLMGLEMSWGPPRGTRDDHTTPAVVRGTRYRAQPAQTEK